MKTLCLIFLAMFAIGSHANETTYTPKATQVSENVYAIIGPLGQRSEANAGLNANYGFIITADGVILIDSGASAHSAALLKQAIATVTTKPVRWVLNTGSQDHRWLGNAYFEKNGAEIHALKETVSTQQRFAQQQLSNLKAFIGDQIAGTVPQQATVLHRSSEENILIAGEDIQWIVTNAHYPGDTMIYLPKQSVVFTGDLVYVDRLLGVLPQSNVRQADQSFKKMMSLNPKFIVPGHGRITDVVQAKRETGDYYTFLIENIGAAAKEMEPMSETLDQFDQPQQFIHLKNFQELHRANMSRVYLDFETNP